MRIGNSQTKSGVALYVQRSAMTLALSLAVLTPVAARAVEAPLPVAAVPAIPSVPAPMLAVPAGAEKGDTTKSFVDTRKGVAETSEKITEGAKNLVKRLDNMSTTTSLEDLNAAKQTVARIEAIIEIEKRLAELDKIRNDRSGGGKGLAAAIPASALVPPKPIASIKSPMAAEEAPTLARTIKEIRPANRNIEIVRISGIGGKYEVTLKTDEGTKTLSAGEKVGSARILSISPSSALIEENGETRTLRIKTSGAFFSAMR